MFNFSLINLISKPKHKTVKQLKFFPSCANTRYLPISMTIFASVLFCSSVHSQERDQKKDVTDLITEEGVFFTENWRKLIESNGITTNDDRSLWSNELFGKKDLSKENVKKRDRFAKHFRLANGSTEAVIAAGPIHYFENNTWKTIYHDLQSINGMGYANIHNEIKTFYPLNSTGNIETRLPDGRVIIDMKDLSMYFQTADGISEKNEVSEVLGSVQKNRIVYKNAFAHEVDIRLTQNTLTRKMDYILNSSNVLANAPIGTEFLVFEETVILPRGYSVQLVNNEIIVLNQRNQMVSKYVKPLIRENFNGLLRQINPKNKENAKESLIYGQYDYEQQGQLLTIKLKVNYDWLKGSDRVFPIAVDPTASFYPDVAQDDQTGNIESRSNTLWNWNGGTAFQNRNPFMYLGHNIINYSGNSYDEQTFHAYSLFDISSINDAATIDATTINVYYDDTYSSNIEGWAAAYVTHNFTHFTDVGLSSIGNVLADCRDGEIYASTTLYGTDNDMWISKAIAATADVQAALAVDSWGLGMHSIDCYYSDDYFSYSGVDQVNKPYISITYTSAEITTTASLSDFSSCEGVSGTSQSFTVEGTDLTEDITVTAPTGYEVSLDDASFSDNLLVTGAPTISSTTVYVRLKSSASGSNAGNIVCSSSGATSVNEAVSGIASAAPTSVNAGSDELKCPNSSSIALSGSHSMSETEKSDAPAVLIPDADVVTGITRTLSLSNTGLNANQITSCELNVTCTWAADIEAYLYAPDNSFIKLVADRGSSGDNFVNTVFKDGAATSITSGSAPFTGEYSPEEAFSTLTGSADGTWTLRIFDDASGDISTLDNWNIKYTAEASYSWQPFAGLDNSLINNPNASPASTTTYTMTVTANGCNSSDDIVITVGDVDDASISSDLTANDSYVWSGNTSSDWSVANNWYKYDGSNWGEASSAPSTSDKVFLLDDNGQACISSTDASATGTLTNLTVKSGANLTLAGTLTINGNLLNEGTIDLSSRTLDVKGNFTSNGTLTEGTGTVSLTGSSAQTVAGSDLGFYKLTVNNSNGASLSNDASISEELTLTNGHLTLGSSNLTLGSTAKAIAGTLSSSNMIVAAGTGELRKEFTSIGTFDFPVGTIAGGDEYSPVTLTFNSGTTFAGTEYVGVRVQDARCSSMNSGVNTYINRNWVIEPSVGISNYDYDVELHYVDADVVLGSFTEGDIVPVKYSAGQWYQADMINSVFTNTIKQGSGFMFAASNYMAWGGLTTFSEFGGGGGSGQPLPVELTSFNGACDNGVISLAWETASENNSSHFDVEKSRDGENWTVLSTIAAAGTSNEIISYQAVDHSATDGNNYFRLRQVDIDGTEKLYDPINVSCEAISVGYFSSYPNPSGNAFQIVVNNEDLVGECVLNMVDAQGKVIERRAIEVKPGINMFVMNQNLNPGMYFLNVSNGSNSTPVIRHSIK
jgi:hypothetical protein